MKSGQRRKECWWCGRMYNIRVHFLYMYIILGRERQTVIFMYTRRMYFRFGLLAHAYTAAVLYIDLFGGSIGCWYRYVKSPGRKILSGMYNRYNTQLQREREYLSLSVRFFVDARSDRYTCTWECIYMCVLVLYVCAWVKYTRSCLTPKRV